MANAIQLDFLLSALLDANGDPLSGAIIVTRNAANSAAKAVWEDKDKTLPSGAGKSQFNLDSEGRAEVFGDGVYTIIVYASTDTGLTSPLYTFSGVSYIDSATADLGSTDNGKGASLVAIEDAASNYTAINVEAALAEVRTVAVMRERLSAGRTYYVRTDGNDSNTGLVDSAGGAFLTIQKAVDTVYDNLDLNGQTVTIQVQDGTYTDGVVLANGHVGEGTVLLFGNTSTPASCFVDTTSEDAIRAEKGAVVTVRGFKLATTTSGIGLVAYTGAFISTQLMEFGDCAGSQIEIGTGGTIIVDGDYAITGDAVSHYHAGSDGTISVAAINVAVTGSPAFSAYFAGAAEGTISFPNVTFSSTSATGPFFLAHKNGTIDIGSNNVATYIPGDASGTVNTGGIIATTDRAWTPVLSFDTPGDLNVVYSTQKGYWSRVGDLTVYTCDLVLSTFTHTTAAGNLKVTGLPFSTKNVANVNHLGSTYWTGITKANYTQVGVHIAPNTTVFSFPAFGSGQAVANVGVADMPTGGTPTIRFSAVVLSQTAD